jgi:phosphonate transport system permease protein
MIVEISDKSRLVIAEKAKQEQKGIGYYLLWAIAFVVLAHAWQGAEIRPLDFIKDSGNMQKYAKEFFPPSFREWRLYVTEMIVTLQIAIWGTLLAIICSVPFGLLCSSNIVPAYIYHPARRLMDSFRAINEMVFALLFIVAVGLGPFAGVLALFVHTTGTLSKLFSEAVEAIDPRPVEGIRAIGGSAMAEIVFGVLPQVMSLWVSFSLYRFESNFRSASVVGLVGAGGIGVILYEAIRGFQYTETCAILIILIVTVSCIDLLSSFLRKRLI